MRKKLTSSWLRVSNEDLVRVEEVQERRNDAVTVPWDLVDAGRCELHQGHGVGPQLQTLLRKTRPACAIRRAHSGTASLKSRIIHSIGQKSMLSPTIGIALAKKVMTAAPRKLI